MNGRSSSLSTQKEISDVLNRQNTVRAFLSALVLAILAPVYILVIHLTGIYGTHSGTVKIWLTVFEVFQIVMAYTGYVVFSHREDDWRVIHYMLYYSVTSLILLIVAGFDLTSTGSVALYIIAAAYASLLPLLQSVKYKVYMGIFILGSIVSVSIAHSSIRNIADVIIICAIAVAVSRVVGGYASECERVAIKLRAKTISSEKDPLTGLNNRRGLDRKASVLLPYCAMTGTGVGVIEIDIDFFKKYNDKFGHPAGDKCLKLVAKALSSSARRSADIIARTGGEEFIVFVQNMDESELVDFAMRIRSNIAELKIPHAYAVVSKYVTVSMGISFCIPDENTSFAELYESADKALYQAKNNGRNCVVCNNHIYGKMRNGAGTLISG